MNNNYIDLYVAFLKSRLQLKYPLKVVYDCSNGTTSIILKKLFAGVKNLKSIGINTNLDPNFSAHGPDPWQKDAMNEIMNRVVREKADLGFIFDGDGDRVFFIDENGALVKSDSAAYLIRKLFPAPYVIDVRSGRLLRKDKVFISRVGHFFIKRLMRETKSFFASEESGHYYYKDFFYCDSGILTSIYMMNQVNDLLREGKSLSSWQNELPRTFRIQETNFKVKNKDALLKKLENKYKLKEKKVDKLDGLFIDLGSSWFLVRFSNTEPLLRLNAESNEATSLKKLVSEIKLIINS